MVIQDIKYQKQYFYKFFGLTKREQERYRRSQRDKLIINLVLDKSDQSRLWDMRKVEFWSRATNTTLFARNCNRSVKHVCLVFVSEALQMSLDNLKKFPQWIETSHRQNPITKEGPLKTLTTTLKGTGRVYRLLSTIPFRVLPH